MDGHLDVTATDNDVEAVFEALLKRPVGDDEHRQEVVSRGMNEIMATHGKRYIQEDVIAAFNHGSVLGDFDALYDKNRMEPAVGATHLYEQKIAASIAAAWQELLSAYRTACRIDMVKMVVIDLDDTLWRGTIAEREADELPTAEGWPRAFWEALEILKRRGILLAIISKNEESLVLERWDGILGRSLALDDITMRCINWRPKIENMTEILAHVNLLPHSVV